MQHSASCSVNRKLFRTICAFQVSGLKSSTSGSLAAFDRMEQKVVAMEAEADAVGQVGIAYISFCTLHFTFCACLAAYT